LLRTQYDVQKEVVHIYLAKVRALH
jgi:hypothetical protein